LFTYNLFRMFFFSSRRRHTSFSRDWSSDVCSSDLSTDLNSPEPGPPLESIHSVRYASQKPAYMTCGFDGVSARSTAPARSLRYSTLRQVLPPSVLLNTPRSSFGPNSRPSAATYTRSQLVGWMRMRPIARASVSPMCVQVLPASVDL